MERLAILMMFLAACPGEDPRRGDDPRRAKWSVSQHTSGGDEPGINNSWTLASDGTYQSSWKSPGKHDVICKTQLDRVALRELEEAVAAVPHEARMKWSRGESGSWTDETSFVIGKNEYGKPDGAAAVALWKVVDVATKQCAKQ